MSEAAGRFGRTASGALDKASRSAGRFQNITKNILVANLIQRGMGMISSGAQTATEDFMQLDTIVTGAVARFDDIGPSASNARNKVAQFSKEVRDLAAGSGFNATDIAQGLNFIAKAGWDSSVALGILKQTVFTARAGDEGFAETLSMMENLMGTLSLRTGNATKDMANYKMMTDVMTAANNASNIELKDISETLSIAGPTAMAAGADFKDLAAMTAFLGMAGIKGSVGGTTLKKAFTSTIRPTKKAAEAFEVLGVKTTLANGDLKQTPQLFRELGASLGKFKGNAAQLAAIETIFGKYGLAGNTLLIKSPEMLEKFRGKMDEALDSAEKMDTFMRGSLGIQFDTLKTKAEEAGFKILSAFGGDASTGMMNLADAISKFDVSPFIVIGKALSGIVDAAKFISPVVVPAIIALGMAFTYLKIRTLWMGAGGLIVQAAWGLENFLNLAMGGPGVMYALGNAFGRLNLLVAANPIVAFTLAVGALLSYMWQLEESTGKISKFLDDWHLKWVRTGLADAWAKFSGVDVSADKAINSEVVTEKAKTDWLATQASRGIKLKGQIAITGAPKGSTASMSTSAGPVDTEMLGDNW